MEPLPIIVILMGIFRLGRGLDAFFTGRDPDHWDESHNFGAHYEDFILANSILECFYGLFFLVVLPFFWYFTSTAVFFLSLIVGITLINIFRRHLVRKYANDLEDSAQA